MAESAEFQAWTEAFKVITYSDPQAIAHPQYKDRGRKVHGPFKTYSDAEWYGRGFPCTHYSIEKFYVKSTIHPPFIDSEGNRRVAEDQLFIKWDD